MAARREVDIDAPPEDVWEALASEEGRERWLEEPDRTIEVELSDAPNRIVWWWAAEDQPATRVELTIVAAPAGSRVVVTESVPIFPIEMFAAQMSLVLA
jgi:uncharacterized protein YndB with AHSA1/START domain